MGDVDGDQHNKEFGEQFRIHDLGMITGKTTGIKRQGLVRVADHLEGWEIA